MNPFFISAISIFIFFFVWFIFSIFLKRTDIIDIAWGLSFVFLSWILYFLVNQEQKFLSLIVLISIWGARLALHIFLRNFKKPEDFRYQTFKKIWGKNWIKKSFFKMFIPQEIFMFLISLSIISTSLQKNLEFNFANFFGFFLFAIGFFFEAVGDWQLSKFKKDKKNKGKILKIGVWRLTRHPNYFGEVVIWWGIFLISINFNFLNFLSILSPITITILLLKISGIPMLEKKYEGNVEFEKYKKETNAFFPWFPKNSIK